MSMWSERPIKPSRLLGASRDLSTMSPAELKAHYAAKQRKTAR